MHWFHSLLAKFVTHHVNIVTFFYSVGEDSFSGFVVGCRDGIANAHTWVCRLRENYLNSFKVLPFARNIFTFYVKSCRYFMCKGAVVLATLREMGVTGGEFGGSRGAGPGAKINPDCSKYHFWRKRRQFNVTKVIQRLVFRENTLRREPSVSIRKKYPLEPRVPWKWKNIGAP